MSYTASLSGTNVLSALTLVFVAGFYDSDKNSREKKQD